jgi:hypothetical protein
MEQIPLDLAERITMGFTHGERAGMPWPKSGVFPTTWFRWIAHHHAPEMSETAHRW